MRNRMGIFLSVISQTTAILLYLVPFILWFLPNPFTSSSWCFRLSRAPLSSPAKATKGMQNDSLCRRGGPSWAVLCLVWQIFPVLEKLLLHRNYPVCKSTSPPPPSKKNPPDLSAHHSLLWLGNRKILKLLRYSPENRDIYESTQEAAI